MAPTSPPTTLSSFTVAPTLSPFNIAVKDYLASHPSTSYIVTGALVFSHGTPLQLLIVQRAPQDFLPNLWEIPGGTCDADEAILSGTARELWEESGLVATEVLGQIGEGYWLGDKENGWFKFTFEVEVEGMEVNLDDEEHQAFFWATEEECRMGVIVREGKRTEIKWTSESQLAVILEGFRLRRERCKRAS